MAAQVPRDAGQGRSDAEPKRPAVDAADATVRPATRTIMKFDAGRRAFNRAIVTLAISAAGLLAFAVYFFWNLL